MPDSDTATLQVVVNNKLGLHARPAAMLVQAVSKYESDILIHKGSQKVNGKSIMGVMMLAAGQGTKLRFEVSGSDADQVVQDIEELFNRNFDEE